MSDGSEKRPLTKMLWSVSIKTRTFASVNTCNGSFQSCLKLLKQYRTIEQMCSDAYSITLTKHLTSFFSFNLFFLTFDFTVKHNKLKLLRLFEYLRERMRLRTSCNIM